MDELMPLNRDTLRHLPNSVRVPRYDRASLSAGMIHIGLGNFHRAHQAWFLHRLFDEGLCHDWAIIGAGVRKPDAIQREKLKAQDWLTTLIELDPTGKSAEVIGSMIDYIQVEDGNAALIARMAEPDIRIVSLTVTEGGYYVDSATNGFDTAHPDMVHDAAHPQTPKTAFGAMIEALRLRRERGHGPFTGLSCDNLQGNGAILRSTLVSLARLSCPDLAAWIDEQCSFPNSMVDCIVPVTGPEELKLARTFAVDDQSPVTHENFRQWVVEDDFCAGRPDWDRVGVTFSNEVHRHEMMKLRILNGGHQIIAMSGELLGIETISATMIQPSIQQFLDKVVREEIAPHITAVPAMSPLAYLDLIIRRFSNPEIKDTTRRVAFDGSSRQPGFLLPSIRDGLHHGTPIDGLALATAMWSKYCEGLREDGSLIQPNDPNWTELNRVALAARNEPALWLAQQQYYGDLACNRHFEAIFVDWHSVLTSQGVAAAIDAFCSGAVNQSFAGRCV